MAQAARTASRRLRVLGRRLGLHRRITGAAGPALGLVAEYARLFGRFRPGGEPTDALREEDPPAPFAPNDTDETPGD